ncbi:nuclease-related domain-containing protein [Planococcus salinus]|uniref:NERD domain-containing protein n=1 Tax=Planococcus salinus TaxID=1848460 RepID=A0A3M8PB56_9BACL|nr:nuclease-related domain-containing protein [Planococcus salinus]RNF40948.1 NERD domain-containing protein [Planococcus salinus]
MNNELLIRMILAERLPKNHAAWNPVTRELKNALAGAGGEERTLALLNKELELPESPMLLKDLHIPIKEGYAQIDILLLHRKFVCVLEVKNMTGEFYFDTENFQFHRMIDGRREGMKNPESQLHRAVKAAEKFLHAPVDGIIVLASRSGRVVEGPKHYPVVSLDYLPFYLEKLAEGEKRLDPLVLAAKLRSLPKRDFRKQLLERYGVSLNEIRLGVTCKSCRNCAMIRSERKWHCVRCGMYSKDAHEVTLQEFAVLFGEELPTGFAYRLLGVEDKYVLYRLLEKSALQGNERGKRWIVPRPELLEAYFRAVYR